MFVLFLGTSETSTCRSAVTEVPDHQTVVTTSRPDLDGAAVARETAAPAPSTPEAGATTADGLAVEIATDSAVDTTGRRSGGLTGAADAAAMTRRNDEAVTPRATNSTWRCQ